MSELFYDTSRLTDFQKKINIPAPPATLEDKLEEATSVFHIEFRKTIWYTIGYEELTAVATTDGYEYKASTRYTYLNTTILEILLPALRLTSDANKKYKVKWCHNIGINILKEAKMLVGTELWQTITPQWFSDIVQWNEKVGPGFRRTRRTCLGNVPQLQEPSDFLPEYLLTIELPWYYRADPCKHFPVYKLNDNTPLRHTINIETNILKLIQLIDVEKNTYVNFSEMEKLDVNPITLEIFTGLQAIKPRLVGEYSQCHRLELECSEASDVLYIDDIIQECSDNPTKAGTKASLNLESNDLPVKAIFFKAENVNSLAYNIYGNYTTNILEANKGMNPISRFGMKGDKNLPFKDLPIEYAERISVRHFSSAPFEIGYNAMSFCQEPFALDIEPGIVYTNAHKFTFELRNKTNNEYNVYLIKLITREVDINKAKGTSKVLQG